MTRAERMAKKLHGKTACPECGYELKEGDEVKVSDWNLVILDCRFFEDNWLVNYDTEMTEAWKDEEEVECPGCGDWSPMKEWGNLSF